MVSSTKVNILSQATTLERDALPAVQSGSSLYNTDTTSMQITYDDGTTWDNVVKSDGTGATGTWPISITGTSAGAPPTGTAGGDLTGTYPNPTVSALNGNDLGVTTPGVGALLIGSGSEWVSQTMSGDGTLAADGTLTVTFPSISLQDSYDGGNTIQLSATTPVEIIGIDSLTPAGMTYYTPGLLQTNALNFDHENDASERVNYASMTTLNLIDADGIESGLVTLNVIEDGSLSPYVELDAATKIVRVINSTSQTLDTAATLSDITGGGTLQSAYDAGNTITMTAARKLEVIGLNNTDNANINFYTPLNNGVCTINFDADNGSASRTNVVNILGAMLDPTPGSEGGSYAVSVIENGNPETYMQFNGIDALVRFNKDTEVDGSDFKVTTGSIEVTLGNITAFGNITTTNGGITSTIGNIVATTGDIIATSGDITATSGDISTLSGDITATSGVLESVGVDAMNPGTVNLYTPLNTIGLDTGYVDFEADDTVARARYGRILTRIENNVNGSIESSQRFLVTEDGTETEYLNLNGAEDRAELQRKLTFPTVIDSEAAINAAGVNHVITANGPIAVGAACKVSTAVDFRVESRQPADGSTIATVCFAVTAAAAAGDEIEVRGLKPVSVLINSATLPGDSLEPSAVVAGAFITAPAGVETTLIALETNAVAGTIAAVGLHNEVL